MHENFDWFKPSPLWQSDGQDLRSPVFYQPALLEMKTDDFVNEFTAAASKPDGIASSLVQTPPAGQLLKLFQPMNSRYYLACASLCCREPGFPDREVRTADGESAFLVLRKLVDGDEQAWVVNGNGRGEWKRVTNRSDIEHAAEERLPLFPVTSGNDRPIMFGYIPTTSRETYSTAITSATVIQAEPDPRPGRLEENIIRPLTELLGSNMASVTASATALARQVSLYLLLDLGTFLSQNIPRVFNALPGPGTGLVGNEPALMSYLMSVSDGQKTLAQAIKEVANKAGQIAQLSGGDPLPVVFDLRQFNFPGANLAARVAGLRGAVKNALPAYQPSAQPAPPATLIPKLLARPGERYVVRCVYDRAQCDPPHRYVSRPTEPFQFASVLDPDGPPREIRIELPRDVSIAGLRKFKQGVGFLMSDAMRNKVAMITGAEKSLLKDEGVNDEGGLTLGFLCSFSFQIIFIVAFFLLLMFVVILNIVFWWLPFFRICLPIPVKSK